MSFEVDILGLERRGLRAWPALHSVVFGDWVFRTSLGYTKRANSANACRETFPGEARKQDFREIMAAAEDFYATNAQPTIFRLTPLAGADADPLLAAAGYELVDPCVAMSASLEAAQSSPQVRFNLEAGFDWLDGAASAQEMSANDRGVHDRIVEAIPTAKALAAVYSNGAAAAFGLAVLEQGLVGLFDIVVRRDFRGQGLGRILTRALLAWGQDQGAEAAYLQVGAANHTAIGLYESLGFRTAYRYHYRRRPA